MAGVLVLAAAGHAQVASVAPKGHWSGSPFHLSSVTRVEVSHNSRTAIRQELLDTNMIAVIAASTGLGSKELATLAVAPGPAEEEVWLYDTGGSREARELFGKKLQFYVQGRLGGHTKPFLLSALTNTTRASQITDPDLCALLGQQPDLPGGLLERCGSGIYTNQVGDTFRKAAYCLVDGEVAWRYDFCISRDGAAFNISEWRVDAKEYDPKFRAIISDAENAVRAEMQKEGTLAKFGSVNLFWVRKKEKLRAKGVVWRSPAELNPGVIID